jgi:hypothetical protein
MPRELGDERSRYGRRSLREQIDEVITWPANHRFATGIILVVIVGAVLLSVTAGIFRDPRELAVGDCLFVRTGTAPDDARPIGDPKTVESAVIAGGAETAGCGSSHGHEVSALIDLASLGDVPSDAETACAQAFPAFVGHALDGSRYITLAAVPTAEAQAAGAKQAICLVARDDGQWMDHAARGSGE